MDFPTRLYLRTDDVLITPVLNPDNAPTNLTCTLLAQNCENVVILEMYCYFSPLQETGLL